MLPGDLVVRKLNTAPGLYPSLDDVGIRRLQLHLVEHNEMLLVLALEPGPGPTIDEALRVLLFSARGQTYGWARARSFVPAPKGRAAWNVT